MNEDLRLQGNIAYFEDACECILSGVLTIPSGCEGWDKVRYYEDNCTCTRNYKHLEED